MTRGFWKLSKALARGDAQAAVEIARDIDAEAGPHIQFEEAVFYPELEKLLGKEFTDRLYREHGVGLAVIRELTSLGPGASLPETRRARLAELAGKALDHAVSCGTLLAHLEALDGQRQGELLAELEAMRVHGVKWSELGEQQPRKRPG